MWCTPYFLRAISALLSGEQQAVCRMWRSPKVLCFAAIVFITVQQISAKASYDILKLSSTELKASYFDMTAAISVWISSTPDTLSISTNDIELLHAGQSLGAFRSVTINNQRFIQHSVNGVARDYVIPEHLASVLDICFKESDEKLLEQLLASLQAVDKKTQHSALEAAILSLVSRPEVAMIKQLAITLGRDLGVSIDSYPSTLPFYLAVLQLSKIGQSNGTRISTALADDDCLDECPPCSDQECLGMCGYGCSCWKWVCGDCCYHLGCYDHDVCCREDFTQIKCLFPFGFKCEENYDC